MPESTASSAPIAVQRVRQLFSQPDKVAASAFLRREVASRMHERLDLIKLAPLTILDAGCGDGADVPLLAQRFAQAQLFGLDASAAQMKSVAVETACSPMQKFLGKLLPNFVASSHQAQWICADFAHLPLRDKSLDLLWSNLALHWHPQPDLVLREWHRSLKESALLMFSCFGPDTFRQLRLAFASAGIPGGHLLPFVDMHDLGDMLVDAGFAAPVMDMEMIAVTYTDLHKMLADVRAFGGNPLENRPRGLLGRKAFERLWQALREQNPAALGANDQYCISFEVIYGHAFRPVARKTAAGEAIIQFSRPAKKS